MINPQEKKRLLQKRAKRELEKAGYGLKKLQSGEYLVIDGETEKTLAKFKNIEQVGQCFGLWGGEIPDEVVDWTEEVLDKTGKWIKPPDTDPFTGRDTPEAAAVREKVKPKKIKATTPPAPKGD